MHGRRGRTGGPFSFERDPRGDRRGAEKFCVLPAFSKITCIVSYGSLLSPWALAFAAARRLINEAAAIRGSTWNKNPNVIMPTPVPAYRWRGEQTGLFRT
jgi:hypothetical protein